MGASLQEALAKRMHEDTVTKIQQKCWQNPDVALRAWALIEAGACVGAGQSLAGKLPPCCNKFKLLKKPVVIDILAQFGTFAISDLAAMSKQELDHLTSYVLNLDPTCALFSKFIDKLMIQAKLRYQTMGNRLETLTTSVDTNTGSRIVDWAATGSGAYTFADLEDGFWTTVKHVSGTTAPLSEAEIGSRVTDLWNILHNHDTP